MIVGRLSSLLFAALTLFAAQTAFAELVPAYPADGLQGPAAARGVIVWSHGRSLDSEDREAPTPPYLRAFSAAGWDVMRFNRWRLEDSLRSSSRVLTGLADELAGRGYRKVVLSGQSFGAFLSLMVAGRTDSVTSVIATAPAAYGSYSESYGTYRQNAERLWPILNELRSARVMMFFFHGDDFDPGGRGEAARAVLASQGTGSLVIDQPSGLTGHAAAATGLFVRRFGACLVRFAEGAGATAEECEDRWGERPSADLLAVSAASSGSWRDPSDIRPYLGRWFGTYVNGREVLLSVRPGERAGSVEADYVLGPGVEPGQTLERSVRQGRLEDGRLVFDEPGFNRLAYRLRSPGALAGEWQDRDGKGSLATVLRRPR
jgi:hypothetical protein